MTPRILILSFALLTACEKTPAPTPPPVEPTPPPEKTPAVAPPKVTYEGDGPVQRARPELLFEHEGMRVERQRWKAGEVEGVAWRARLPRRSAYRVLHTEALERVADLEAPNRAGALINGGFYEDRDGGYGPMGLVIDQGQRLAPYRVRGGSGIFAVVGGEPKIVHRRKRKELQAEKPTVALQSIDRIADAGASLVKPKPQARRAARSAVALTKDHVWLVVVAANSSVRERTDGAQLVKTSYLGLTLGEFAGYLVAELGASEALNLDGAVSTQLLVRTPGGKLHVRGERGVLQGLWIGPE